MAEGKKRKGNHRKQPRGRIANRYRAYPTPEQYTLAKRFGGSCRQVKNLAKEERDRTYEEDKEKPKAERRKVSYTSQSKAVLEMRKGPERPWLGEVPAQVLQQAVADTDRAYKNFFAGVAHYPDWQRRSGGYSFRDPQNVGYRRASKRWGEVKVQGLGWVRVRHHRCLRGKAIKSATVVVEPDGKMFVSVLAEIHDRAPSKPLVPEMESCKGVDLGVEVAVATYDGYGNAELMDRQTWSLGERRRLKALEQARERKKLSREKKDKALKEQNKKRALEGEEPLPLVGKKSKNQEKVERQIAGLHGRARRRRKDFTEQVSSSLARESRHTFFEGLHIPAMTSSAKGTKDKPGKRVAQKAGLDRAILEKGWGQQGRGPSRRPVAMATAPTRCLPPTRASPARTPSAVAWTRRTGPLGHCSFARTAATALTPTPTPQERSLDGGQNSSPPAERRWQPTWARTRARATWAEPELYWPARKQEPRDGH